MDERTRKAFDFAQESTKQLITLATGVIALSITFSKDFVGTVPPVARMIALLSWGFYLLSVLFGVMTLLALTGTLEPADPQAPLSIRGRNITLPATLQIVLFVVALALTVLFGVTAVTCNG